MSKHQYSDQGQNISNWNRIQDFSSGERGDSAGLGEDQVMFIL